MSCNQFCFHCNVVDRSIQQFGTYCPYRIWSTIVRQNFVLFLPPGPFPHLLFWRVQTFPVHINVRSPNSHCAIVGTTCDGTLCPVHCSNFATPVLVTQFNSFGSMSREHPGRPSTVADVEKEHTAAVASAREPIATGRCRNFHVKGVCLHRAMAIVVLLRNEVQQAVCVHTGLSAHGEDESRGAIGAQSKTCESSWT